LESVSRGTRWRRLDGSNIVRCGQIVSKSDVGRPAARTVAGGILISRLLGLVREASLATFFGAGPHADVFRTALRGPNILQNLLGEQTLSASFIPVYSRLLAEGRREEAGRFAGAIFGLLLAVTAGLSLLGAILAEPLVTLLSAGYLGDAARVAAGEATVDRFPLAVAAVRIVFPMAGLLALSAWCLGVLNSHRRFFLPYLAPALWNAAIIAVLWWVGAPMLAGNGGDGIGPAVARDRLLIAACIGALVGGLLQFGVQLPLVFRLLRGFRLSLSTRVRGVGECLRSFAPLAASRGAVQLSGYLDQLLASFLVAGAQAALGWAFLPYFLPVSLFALSVAAAELPELSRLGERRSADELRQRLVASWRLMLYPMMAAAIGYLLLGFLVVAVLYRRGEFGAEDHWLVAVVLATYSLGLPASGSSRLFTNLFYAIGRTRVPARIAVERVVLSAIAGAGLMLWLDRYPVAGLMADSPPETRLHLGAVGLAAASALAAWYELARLSAAVRRQLGQLELPLGYAGRLLGSAVVAAVPALAAWRWSPLPMLPTALAGLVAYAAGYLILTRLAGISEASHWLSRSRRRTDEEER
jgi:putative peptidoglycan lipid II flippase